VTGTSLDQGGFPQLAAWLQIRSSRRTRAPPNVIRRQLGHRNRGVASIHLQGIDPDEIIETAHGRPQPMIPAGAGLALPFRG
jgi:hypothetical protein